MQEFYREDGQDAIVIQSRKRTAMPELPEVETVRRGLEREIVSSRIIAVKVLRPASVGFPDPKLFTRELKGRTFKAVRRRGKYLLMDFDDGSGMAAHLRMSGRFLILGKRDAEPAHTRIRMELDDGRLLIFDDMRVFGRVWFVPKNSDFEQVVPTLGELGPEPLKGLDSKVLKEKLERKTQPIKSALLDQTIIAGIGNIYADESLHRAGINPLRAAKDLKPKELEKLCKEISIVLNNAIASGGSSLRNYTDASGTNGNYQNEALVYGRKGQECRTCAKLIERAKVAGRSTHYCPKCQK